MLKMIKTVGQYSHDCEQNYTKLQLPPNICKMIQDESKYQHNLYLIYIISKHNINGGGKNVIQVWVDELALNYK